MKKKKFGEIHGLCIELTSYKDSFINYFRIIREQFEETRIL